MPGASTDQALLRRFSRAEDPELDQKLVLRLQQLCQLEAVLNVALNCAPSTLQLPTCEGGLLSLPAFTSGPKVGDTHLASRPIDNTQEYSMSSCVLSEKRFAATLCDLRWGPEHVFEQGKKKAGSKKAREESEMQVDGQAESEEQSANQKENAPSNAHSSADVPVERQEDR